MSRMIYPVRLETKPLLQRLSKRRLVEESADDSLPVSKVRALQPMPALGKRFPKSSFSAQLLALGLRYGMDDLVNKADAEAPPMESERALQHYERAQSNFLHSDKPALFARWSA